MYNKDMELTKFHQKWTWFPSLTDMLNELYTITHRYCVISYTSCGVNWGSHGVALATPENIIGSQEYLFATPKNYDFNYQKIEISI